MNAPQRTLNTITPNYSEKQAVFAAVCPVHPGPTLVKPPGEKSKKKPTFSGRTLFRRVRAVLCCAVLWHSGVHAKGNDHEGEG